MSKTMRQGLQELQVAPLNLNTSAEPLNAMISNESNKEDAKSKSLFHWGSGYNSLSDKRASMSGKYNVFVLGVDGKPLTPTTNAKARKLLKGKQAKPVWNKFGRFGIQMLVETRKETPKTVLGVDFGTKFEGYVVVTGKENNLSVMWKLPDKKKLIRKLDERRRLRRARRYRNCRRRKARFDNRGKRGFIAPSQLMIVNSRLKAMAEFFKCYPIDTVAIEDVKFNHRDNKWGKNFSTVEIGKRKINNWIRQRASLQMFSGMDTQALREEFGYKKTNPKNKEVFTSHCSDALAIATDVYAKEQIPYGDFIVVDDTYRPVRRRLHDTQFSKGGLRYPYSTGNFQTIKKGTICEFGQICGGTKNQAYIYNPKNKRVGKVLYKITWLSHKFKINGGAS